jgi:hypothetical protein
LLEVPTPEEWTWARDFIAPRRWQEAVTFRATAPHEYTIRQWVSGENGALVLLVVAGLIAEACESC